MLIVNEYTLKAARKSYKMLEPYEGKLSRTVLRGESGSNTADSLDYNQKRLRNLENGQCLISDLYGRVGVIQFHPVFEELLHAFDTRPPVRKEV